MALMVGCGDFCITGTALAVGRCIFRRYRVAHERTLRPAERLSRENRTGELYSQESWDSRRNKRYGEKREIHDLAQAIEIGVP